MATLKDFLSKLAVDPVKLGEFIHDPDKAMKGAGLSDDDKIALKSGLPIVVHARMAGLSTKEAFEVALQESKERGFDYWFPAYGKADPVGRTIVWPQKVPPPPPPPPEWPQTFPFIVFQFQFPYYPHHQSYRYSFPDSPAKGEQSKGSKRKSRKQGRTR